ncbi:hypothetical protein [Algoriphagus boritolerans]|nr:hypothetical protein [Algoriphagus boritolerans]
MDLFSGLKLESSATFNNNEVFELEIRESGERLLVLNQDGFGEERQSNYGLVVPILNGELGDFMFIQTLKLDNGQLEINYFSKNHKLVSSISLDPKSEAILVNSGPDPNARLLCGEGVAGCIADAYTNHGWISVWAFVQTAFIPATAAGIAAGCAYLNCI